MNLESLKYAARVIKSGGVVAYPTEACFGFGCDPRNAAAIRRILHIKRRPRCKGLILIADCYSRLLPYVGPLKAGYRQQILDSWPGRYTWVLPAGKRASCWLCGSHRTLAVRVTAHRDAAKLCQLIRMPIVSTSANRSGRRMLRSRHAVLQEFGNEVDFIVEGRIGNAGTPSTICDGQTGQVLRK